jgi:transketolase
MNKTPGVEMSTGALGHGTSVTLGIALAARVLKRNYWSFVIVGDGCLNEGQTWEGIMAAAKFKPDRLVMLVDYNKVQLDGPSDEIMPMDPLPAKLKAFNWSVAPRIYDGHDVEDILRSWDWIQKQIEFPVGVVYKTHKGRGVSFMEDDNKWHGSPIDDPSYKKGRSELVEGLKELEVNL